MAKKIKLLPVILMLLCLSGCMTAHTDIPLTESQPSAAESARSAPEKHQSPTTAPAKIKPYKAPAFASSGFDPEAAQGENGVLMDLSCTGKGYIAVSAVGDTRMKLRVVMGEQVYDYDLPSDGTTTVYPLQCGDGAYTFRALKNITGTNYAEVYFTEAQVKLDDEFQPFLRPSQYVDYSEGSRCVKIASGLAAKQSDALGVVDAVFSYICENVTYDKAKANTVKKGYLPNPDETLDSGKGICFDYASLAAAMLRSQGIPTKVVFGYVQPDDLYHAWNMFYTKESGWVIMDYEVEKNTWSRLDLTFSANGADAEFIGDGTNYTDVYFY